jgi:uncharacterized protein
MEIMRLVVTGTVGAGKSTFIRSVSEIAVVDTDRKATDEVALHIYGTPGQIRFDFMWEILIERAHAYILLVAAHRPKEFHQARRIMNFMNQQVQIPMIIGITHSDCDGAWSNEDVMVALGYQNDAQRPPVVLVNAEEEESVVGSLMALVGHYMAVNNIEDAVAIA